MRVLVTGAGGQLGHDIVRSWSAAGDEVTGATRTMLDVRDRDAVLGTVGALRPDAIVNCAAHTGVDACETEVEQAYSANALAVRWLAEAAGRFGAHLVHLSTDYVFDGTLERPYTEWDAPAPQSVYGASKLAGEREAGDGATIVRTSWVCGEHGNNMVHTVLRLLPSTPVLSFVDDQHGCPTFTSDLAPALRRLALDRRSGIHHLTNQGATSWYGFVRAIVAAAGEDPARVRPISTAELTPPRPAPRPANSVLDNAVARLAGLPLLGHWEEPLGRLVAALRA